MTPIDPMKAASAILEKHKPTEVVPDGDQEVAKPEDSSSEGLFAASEEMMAAVKSGDTGAFSGALRSYLVQLGVLE